VAIVLFYAQTLEASRGPERSSRNDGWYFAGWRVIRTAVIAVSEIVVLILHIYGLALCKPMLILLLLVALLALPLEKELPTFCRRIYYWLSLSANSPRSKESSYVGFTVMLKTPVLALEAAVTEVKGANNMFAVQAIKASSALNRLTLLEALSSECRVVNAFYIYAGTLLDLARLLEKSLPQAEQTAVTTILFRFTNILKSNCLSHVREFMQSSQEITWSQFQVTMSNSIGVLVISAVLVENFLPRFTQTIILNLGELCIVLEQYKSSLIRMIDELSDCSLTTASDFELLQIDSHQSLSDGDSTSNCDPHSKRDSCNIGIAQ
jgi:hypothetical protein